ncbi:MAG: tetratricopeptide repeat protein [Deltaproteobacteria bacterium]|nr:tetratricopeptide repeat protein [Deltaproteobacteria bacterium]
MTWRYVALSLGIVQPCIVQELPAWASSVPVVGAAWAGILAACGAAAQAWRRGIRLPLFALGWFALALAPVSQILAPLQNLMADRYLFVAVLGPCLAVAWALALWRRRASGRGAIVVASMVCLAAGASTFYRSVLFSDAILLWSDATLRTERSTVAPYQLAMALEASGDMAGAEAGFREAVRRDDYRSERGRKAVNNLGRILAARGRLEEATSLYRRAARRWPEDPKVALNLAVLLAEAGQTEEARRRMLEVIRRFPSYEPARRAYRRRWPDPPRR